MRGERPPIHDTEQESPFISLEHWIEHDFERQYRSDVEIMLKIRMQSRRIGKQFDLGTVF